MKQVYKAISKLLSRAETSGQAAESPFNSVFMAYDHDKKEVVNYNVSVTPIADAMGENEEAASWRTLPCLLAAIIHESYLAEKDSLPQIVSEEQYYELFMQSINSFYAEYISENTEDPEPQQPDPIEDGAE